MADSGLVTGLAEVKRDWSLAELVDAAEFLDWKDEMHRVATQPEPGR